MTQILVAVQVDLYFPVIICSYYSHAVNSKILPT